MKIWSSRNVKECKHNLLQRGQDGQILLLSPSLQNLSLHKSAISSSVHGTHEVVDELLAVAVLPALNEVQPLLVEAACRGVQLEGPQEVGALREGRPHIVDLVDQILDADDVLLAQLLQTERNFNQHGLMKLFTIV